jgi:type II secretory pathway component PulF
MKGKWQAEAQEAFEEFVKQMEEELPEGSSFAEIERGLMKLEKRFMAKVVQARSSAGEISPPKE